LEDNQIAAVIQDVFAICLQRMRNEVCTLGLEQDILRANFTPENGLLRLKNTYLWDDII